VAALGQPARHDAGPARHVQYAFSLRRLDAIEQIIGPDRRDGGDEIALVKLGSARIHLPMFVNCHNTLLKLAGCNRGKINKYSHAGR
jgi:hypothetical protein